MALMRSQTRLSRLELRRRSSSDFLLVSDEYFHSEQHDLLLPENQASSMITGIGHNNIQKNRSFNNSTLLGCNVFQRYNLLLFIMN